MHPQIVDIIANAASGAMSSATSVLLLYPLEHIKTIMQLT